MPRTNVDYSRSFIYKLQCLNPAVTKVYIDHSTDFTRRKACHKKLYRQEYDAELYNFIRANGGWDNWTMVKIADYPSKDVYEIERKKAELMQLADNII